MAYQISRSLRFNSADSASLSRTFGSPTNAKIFTFSAWLKRSAFPTTGNVVFGSNNVVSESYLCFAGTDVTGTTQNTLSFFGPPGGDNFHVASNALFRDPSSFFHVILAVDTTQATAANRVRMYVNGAEVTYSVTSYPTLDQVLKINAATSHSIGAFRTTAYYFDGYMADVNFVDGQALTPSSFGETDATTGAWVPKAYSGSFGTNGFWLSFADNSSTTNVVRDDAGGAAGAGAGSNDWTANNISVTAGVGNDSLTDTPTNYGTDAGAGGEVRGNYCTLNPLRQPSGSIFTLSNGNLRCSIATGYGIVSGTFGMSSGKWYWEVVAVDTAAANTWFGVEDGTENSTAVSSGTTANSWSWQQYGNKYGNGGTSAYNGSATYTDGDVIGIALDMDAGELTFYKNGVSQGVAFNSGLAGKTLFPFCCGTSATISSDFNFGQRPFAYTAPSGFKALCVTNITDPAILKPSSYFDANLRTGTGASYSVTGKGFQPDLVWIKGRSGATDHAVYDAVRGVEKRLETNNTDDEVTGDTTGLTAFNSDGYTGGALAQINTNTSTYVDWLWKESITAGLDVVSYTGNGSNRTISHGLGVAPSFMIVKSLATAGANTNWAVYHARNTAAPATDYLLLNSTAATADLDTYWNDTAPTTSVFSVGTHADVNTNADTYIAYLFAEVAGFSKFGSYAGNASADGPFVWCGFKPRWILLRLSSGTQDWIVIDAARDQYNPADQYLAAHSNVAETTYASELVDLLSNGFKIRSNGTGMNTSGGTYIFAAFAEMPFKYASAPWVSPTSDFDMSARGACILP